MPDILDELRWFLPEKNVTKLAWDTRHYPGINYSLVRGCDIPSTVVDTMAKAITEIERLRSVIAANK